MSRTILGGVTVLTVMLSVPSVTRAESVRLLSGDGAVLAGRYTPGREGPRSPAVIVLDDIGLAADPKRCDELAALLAADGCAVLCLDFRGQGGSTQVNPDFWSVPANRAFVKGGGRARDTISTTDFLPGYRPALANDVAAARALMTLRSDRGECNAGQTIVVGFGDGATVGALWAAAEWGRYRVFPGLPDRLGAEPEGRDLAGCVWVQPATRLDRVPVPLADWVKAVAGHRKTLTGWLYPPTDKATGRLAERIEGQMNKDKDRIVVAEPAGNRSAVLEQVARLVRTVRDTSPAPMWESRQFADRRYAWSPPRGRPVVAKVEGSDWFLPAPIDQLLRQ